MTIARILFDLVVAGIATAGFGLLFRTEGKSLLPCALIGGAGYIVYDWIVLEFASAPVAAFLSCLLVGLIAEAAARILKGPTIVFATMGIIPMVPGYGMYRTMEAFTFLMMLPLQRTTIDSGRQPSTSRAFDAPYAMAMGSVQPSAGTSSSRRISRYSSYTRFSMLLTSFQVMCSCLICRRRPGRSLIGRAAFFSFLLFSCTIYLKNSVEKRSIRTM